MVRLEGHRLTADLEEELPDFEFAFESTGATLVNHSGDSAMHLPVRPSPPWYAVQAIGYCLVAMNSASNLRSAWLSNSAATLSLVPAGGDDEGYGAYYRSERSKALDEHFGDMLHKIHDLEVRSFRLNHHHAPTFACRSGRAEDSQLHEASYIIMSSKACHVMH